MALRRSFLSEGSFLYFCFWDRIICLCKLWLLNKSGEHCDIVDQSASWASYILCQSCISYCILSWLLCFGSSSLLLHLGGKQLMAQVLQSLPQVGDLNGETEDLSFCVSLSLPVTLHCKQVNLLKSYIKNIPAFPCDVSYVKISSASCVIGSLHLDSSIPAWASPHC